MFAQLRSCNRVFYHTVEMCVHWHYHTAFTTVVDRILNFTEVEGSGAVAAGARDSECEVATSLQRTVSVVQNMSRMNNSGLATLLIKL